MMFQVKELLNRIRLGVHQEEKGQTLVEYALIILLVSIVVIGVLILLGGEIGDVFTSIINTLSSNVPEAPVIPDP